MLSRCCSDVGNLIPIEAGGLTPLEARVDQSSASVERPVHKPCAFSPVPLTASSSVSGSVLPPCPAVPLLMDFRKMTTGIRKWGQTGQIQPPSPCASVDCSAARFLLTYILEESVRQAHCVSAAQGEATSSKGSALHHRFCPSTSQFCFTAL